MTFSKSPYDIVRGQTGSYMRIFIYILTIVKIDIVMMQNRPVHRQRCSDEEQANDEYLMPYCRIFTD